MTSDPDASPFNALPPVVVALALVIFGIELVLTMGAEGLIGGPRAVGWRSELINDYAFSDVVWEWMLAHDRWPPEHLIRFVTYPFVHVGFTHMLFVVVFLLALGKMVGEAFGTFAVLAIFFGSAVIGALAFALLTDEPSALVGGYPAVYGLIGAFSYIRFTDLGARGENRMGAFTLIGMLLAIQLLFGIFFDSTLDWVAEVSGFGAGFALSFVVSPGGWQRLLARMRDR